MRISAKVIAPVKLNLHGPKPLVKYATHTEVFCEWCLCVDLGKGSALLGTGRMRERCYHPEPVV